MATGRDIELAAKPAAAGVIAPSATAQADPAPIPLQQLVANYAAAWTGRDPDRITALHTSDTVFDLRIAGETRAVGRAAVRERFGRVLCDNPSYSSVVDKVGFGPDFVVIEYRIAMDPPAAFSLGRFRYTPTGTPYAVPAIDIIHFRDSLVSEKVTFLDTDIVRANSRTDDASQAPR